MNSPETNVDAGAGEDPRRCGHGTTLEAGDCEACGEADARAWAALDALARKAYAALARARDSAEEAYTLIQELGVADDELLAADGDADALGRLDAVSQSLRDVARILEVRNLRALNSELTARITELENEQ